MTVISDRIAQVRAQFESWDVDAVIITHPINRQWLTGFAGSMAIAAVTADDAIIATDGRYWLWVEEQCPDVTLYKYGRSKEALKQFIESLGAERIGFESNHTTVSEFKQYKTVESVQWKALGETCETLRFVKSADEIAITRKSAAIADLAMSHVNEIAEVGMSEKALAWELEKIMRENGADGLAFDIIVASGANGARPHHNPSDRTLAEGDIITIDLGAKLDGYHSDMTRVFHMGSNPSDKFWEIYNLVLSAETATIEQIKAGMTGKEVDAIARDIIADAGYGDDFKHSTGHGVGLEIHEGPGLSTRSAKTIVPANSLVTIEPGIYINGWSGMRIEDLVLVTEDGCEIISKCPKNPIIPIN